VLVTYLFYHDQVCFFSASFIFATSFSHHFLFIIFSSSSFSPLHHFLLFIIFSSSSFSLHHFLFIIFSSSFSLHHFTASFTTDTDIVLEGWFRCINKLKKLKTNWWYNKTISHIISSNVTLNKLFVLFIIHFKLKCM
jgi:hypothetical protein